MLHETLKKLGIEDVKTLPAKTQRKIADYNRLVKTPLGNGKDGQPTPNKKARIQDLVEDIILETKIFLKQGGKPVPVIETPAVPKPGETDKTDPEKPAKTTSRGFLGDLLGI